MIRIGYACINQKLRDEEGIFSSRTARLKTIVDAETKSPGAGMSLLKDLLRQNLADLMKILEWNIEKGITLFRVSSELAPRVTDPELIGLKSRSDPFSLAYDLGEFRHTFREIGHFAKKHKMRLTFHPGQFCVLSAHRPEVLISSIRDLHYHAVVADLMGLPADGVMIVHGGGTYGDKAAASERWVKAYTGLPEYIKRRIVLENDEVSYGIEDVLAINEKCGVPIVFDFFHHKCYKKYHRDDLTPRVDMSVGLVVWIERAVATWGGVRPKMHISGQAPNSPLGAHSKGIGSLPSELIDYVYLKKKEGVPTPIIDLMIEAKDKERALANLMRKYPHVLI